MNMPHKLKPHKFDLKILSFMIYTWGMLNAVNGVIIFNHDLEGAYIGHDYYFIVGTIRILIGFNSVVVAWYIWIFSDDIVIFRRSDEKQTTSHGEHILTTREGGKLHFKE
jgi:hypothetical protein